MWICVVLHMTPVKPQLKRNLNVCTVVFRFSAIQLLRNQFKLTCFRNKWRNAKFLYLNVLFKYLKVKDRTQQAVLYIVNMNYLDPSVYFSDFNSTSRLKKHNIDWIHSLTVCLQVVFLFSQTPSFVLLQLFLVWFW